MGNWICLTKLLILVYIVLEYSGGRLSSGVAVVLFLLLYISLNTTIYLLRKEPYQKLLLISAGLLLTAGTGLIDFRLILLLPINLCELAFLYRAPLWLPVAIGAIPLLIINKALFNLYALTASFSIAIFRLAYQSWDRVRALSRENDGLREKNQFLSGKLNKDLEYEQQLKYASQLEERNKIAQEIHDKLGHTLSGSLLQLEAAKLYLEKDREKAAAILQNVIDLLREGTEKIRSTLKSIKPAPVQLGVNRIRLMLEEFESRHRIKVSLLCRGVLEVISPIQWKVIYDNTCEALTNILKHSRATMVTVTIEVLLHHIRTGMKDNGRGAPAVIKGLGIEGMEERSGRLGGKMIIDGSKGFTIITLLPREGDVNDHSTVNRR